MRRDRRRRFASAIARSTLHRIFREVAVLAPHDLGRFCEIGIHVQIKQVEERDPRELPHQCGTSLRVA
jgi:hypothetical protein